MLQNSWKLSCVSDSQVMRRKRYSKPSSYTTLKILYMIHHPVFYSKQDISQNGFCLHLQWRQGLAFPFRV
jgi:hypothetical protein